MTTDPFTETIISDPYAHAHELAVRPGRDADEVRLDATGHGRTVTIVVPAVELRAALDRAAAQEPSEEEVQEAAVALLAFIHNEPVERIREVYGVLDRDGHWSTQARAALSAARAVRRDEAQQ